MTKARQKSHQNPEPTDVGQPDGKSSDARKRLAVAVTVGTANNALVMIRAQQVDAGIVGLQDLPNLVDLLREASEKIQSGDPRLIEAMLMNQAISLQAIYTNLTTFALQRVGCEDFESCIRIALRAQKQCRVTLDSLTAVRKPAVVFAKQANFANGHQQVNNRAGPRPRKTKISQNKLMENSGEESSRLVPRATEKTVVGHSKVAALGKVHGSEDTCREAKGVAKRF